MLAASYSRIILCMEIFEFSDPLKMSDSRCQNSFRQWLALDPISLKEMLPIQSGKSPIKSVKWGP